MINSILEKRMVNDGLHRIELQISANEYKKIYDDYNDEIAYEILNNHLQNRGDDGRPTNVQIRHEKNNNRIKIFADLHYLGNDHTTYRR
ncbi:MAG: hypothetical protein GX238_10325 [Epulopiscium sp.]|nr:hypothetical protein [Candidatus Epulonipiscium sp.]